MPTVREIEQSLFDWAPRELAADWDNVGHLLGSPGDTVSRVLTALDITEDVADEVRELLEELRDVAPENVLIAAAYFHAKFENTHPFADGNGRVGRLAMNYLPVLHGHPPVIIHEEDRKKYYGALEAWDARQELVPLREFLIGQTEKM